MLTGCTVLCPLSPSQVSGLYKIFDEILVNSADNKVNDPTQSKIEVVIDAATGTISVYNDGTVLRTPAPGCQASAHPINLLPSLCPDTHATLQARASLWSSTPRLACLCQR